VAPHLCRCPKLRRPKPSRAMARRKPSSNAALLVFTKMTSIAATQRESPSTYVQCYSVGAPWEQDSNSLCARERRCKASHRSGPECCLAVVIDLAGLEIVLH
jgi:hypothetical protein